MDFVMIAIALEIIAITAATFLLVRAKTELMGRWFRMAANVLVIAGWLALACSSVQCVMGVICCVRECGGTYGGHCGPGEGSCGHKEKACGHHSGHHGKEMKDGDHHHGEMEHHHNDSLRTN